jgi:hypothetical protein
VAERPDRASGPTGYTERLSVPWWLWAPALAACAILAAQIGLGAAGIRGWGPYVVVLPLAAYGLWSLGRIRMTVTNDTFVVDDAKLPRSVIADVIPLDGAGKRELLGPGADPLAFVIQRPWTPGAVQILLDDPQDPTPYWVVSTRHPQRLAAALTAG